MAPLLAAIKAKKTIALANKETLVTGGEIVNRELKENGVSVLIVTHDVEFAAECADRCALLFRGRIVSSGTPRDFFSENTFYTTAISRITRGYLDKAVTLKDIRRKD